MPAKSEKQRRLMAMAEHNPSSVSAKNQGVLSMSQEQLHDFAATKNAPKKAAKKKTVMHGNSSTGHSYSFRDQTGKRAPAKMSKMTK